MKDPQFGLSGACCAGHGASHASSSASPVSSTCSSASPPTRPASLITNRRSETPLCAQPELCACPVGAVGRACAVGGIRALGIPACATLGEPRRQQRYLSARPAAPHSRPFRVLVAHEFRQSQGRLVVRGTRERRLAVVGRRSSALPETV